MRIRQRAALMACAALIWAAAVVPPGAAQEAAPKAKKSPASSLSLIRLDLLQTEVPALEAPLRNIFAPHRGGARAKGRLGPSGRLRPGEVDPDRPEGENPETRGEEELESGPAVTMLTLRYVGFVSSSERTVGVVIYQGDVLAVKPGELIAEGVTILKITPEEIVFQGPDAESRTVSLEGEDR